MKAMNFVKKLAFCCLFFMGVVVPTLHAQEDDYALTEYDKPALFVYLNGHPVVLNGDRIELLKGKLYLMTERNYEYLSTKFQKTYIEDLWRDNFQLLYGDTLSIVFEGKEDATYGLKAQLVASPETAATGDVATPIVLEAKDIDKSTGFARVDFVLTPETIKPVLKGETLTLQLKEVWMIDAFGAVTNQELNYYGVDTDHNDTVLKFSLSKFNKKHIHSNN